MSQDSLPSTSFTKSNNNNKKFPSKDIITYDAPWDIYSISWSEREDQPFRLACGSFLEQYENKIHVISLNDDSSTFTVSSIFDHPYPCTKSMFFPDKSISASDLLATSGDVLRLYDLSSSSLVSSFSLRSSSFCSPLTSFDWSFDNPLHIATSSIDSTVTVWDISKPKHPLHYVLAHPKKEVFDVSFVSSSVFASCSADGSVRCFDMRDLSTSDILYESSRPLLRLAWNRIEPDYFAVFEFDSDAITVLDRRFTSSPVAILSSAHSKPVNSFSWAPHSSFHMATASDDSSVFIWPLNQRLDDPSRYKPLSSFSAPAPIHSLSWSRLHFHWMALSFGSHLQLVRV